VEHLTAIYGLCLVVGGVIALTVPASGRHLLAWRWLAAFAIADGGKEWLELFSGAAWPWLPVVSTAGALAMAMLAAEGLRRSLAMAGREGIPAWSVPALAGVGLCLAPLTGLETAIAGSLLLPAVVAAGSLAAGLPLGAGPRLRLGWRMSLFALTTYLALEAAEAWLEDGVVPVLPVIRVAMVVLMGAGWLLVSTAVSPATVRGQRLRHAGVVLGLVLAVLAVGMQIALWNRQEIR
jgi:hypothetical protein